MLLKHLLNINPTNTFDRVAFQPSKNSARADLSTHTMREMKNVVFSPNRKGDNKILTPKEENSVPRGEAARDRILLPAG